jgi:hypothetical protein
VLWFSKKFTSSFLFIGYHFFSEVLAIHLCDKLFIYHHWNLQEFDGNKLIYFDNGATSQKPYSVMKTLGEYYRSYNSNVHRGIHALR